MVTFCLEFPQMLESLDEIQTIIWEHDYGVRLPFGTANFCNKWVTGLKL